MRCAGCGRDNPESARFCVGCGAGLPRCPACGVAVSTEYSFCPGCGRPLQADGAIRPIVEVNAPVLRSSTPTPELGRPLQSSSLPTSAGEQERRQVAILFADLVGFTALSERLDPEEVHTMVQACLTTLGEVVTQHGGHVDKFIGDSIMALFGAPVAHEDDVPRALAAASSMLDRIESMNESVMAEPGVRLAVRIGINAGLVVAGELGRPGDYTVIGDAVNVASRIQGLAHPGSIVVTGPVRALAEGAFQFAASGSVTVKNRSAPVEIFELVAAGPAASAPQTPPRTAFVGRDRELSRLHELAHEACEGLGTAIWIVAEAGMGKSRLVAEFTRALRPEVLVLTGHCRGYAAPLYLPFRHWFEQLAAGRDRLGLGPQAEWRQLLGCPGDFDYLERALFPERERVQLPDPETGKQIAQRALIEFICALCRRSPLVLVLEDLHWADALTLEVSQRLTGEAAHLPMLLVGTARPDGAGVQPGQELQLGPLDADALHELLSDLLKPYPVSADAVRWLLTATQGNPFFLEELTTSLRSAGDLVLQSERWALARSLTELRVPDTVRGVVQARIDALDPLARTVVREAAVLGTPFDRRVLQVMSSSPGSLDDLLEQLEEIRILAPATDDAPDRRSFYQVITQQVAYESLLTRRRRELHERAAQAIESLYSGLEAEVIDDLAEHYARSEAREPAIRYLGLAAARAQGLYANSRARTHYARLLQIAETAPANEKEAYSHACILAECGLADLESLVGEFDAAVARLLRLGTKGEIEPVLRAGIYRRLAVLLAKRGEANEAAAHLLSALPLVESQRTEEGRREAARVWYQQAVLCYRRGEYAEAEESIRRSAEAAEVADDAALLADALLLRGLVEYDTGRRREARDHLEAALERKEAIGDLRGMAAALHNLGNLVMDEGRFTEARQRYEQALALRRRIGQREGIAAAEINLGNVALSLGDWDEAQQRLETAQALCEEIGDAYGALGAAANRGRLALETNHPREARRRYQAAVERASHLGFTNLAIDARIGLAEAELALGDSEKALVTATAAREEAETVGDPILVAAALRATATAAAATGRMLASEADFAASRRAFQEHEQPLEEARTMVCWAAGTDDTERAVALLSEAELIARRLGAAGELERIQRLRARRLNPPTGSGSRRR